MTSWALLLLPFVFGSDDEDDPAPPRGEVEALWSEVDRQQGELEHMRARLREVDEDDSSDSFLERIRINVYVNVLAQRDDKDTRDDEGREIGDRARVRKVDLDLRAPLGGSADAVVIGSIESDPVNDYDTDLDQAFARVRLFEDSDWPVALVGGRIRSSFGRDNTWTIFVQPWPTRPLVVTEFLGEDGFKQTGGSVAVDLPVGDAQEARLTCELLGTGDIEFADRDSDQFTAIVGDLDWRFPVGDQSYVLCGTSGYTGRGGDKEYLAGVDALFRWESPAGESPRSFTLGAEGMIDFSDVDGRSDDPLGGYVWAQFQVFTNWFFTTRLDYIERVENPDDDVVQGGVYVAWEYSKRLRVTGGYEHAEGDESAFDGRNDVFFEVNFSLGQDPLEPFWSRR